MIMSLWVVRKSRLNLPKSRPLSVNLCGPPELERCVTVIKSKTLKPR